MQLTVVSGSHRPNSESGKVARFIKGLAQPRVNPGFDSVYLLDLGMKALPLWDEELQNPGTKDRAGRRLWKGVSAKFSASQAFVFVTPEWSGMAPPALKNLLLLCGENELTHKPALIVAVSSGMGGAYPIAELRANSCKDTKVCYIPEPVIIRQVQHALNSRVPQNDHDLVVRQRLQYSLNLLLEYAKALAMVRESGVVNTVAYPYGM